MVAIHETVMEYASSVSIHDRYVGRDERRARGFAQVRTGSGVRGACEPWRAREGPNGERKWRPNVERKWRARTERGSGGRTERGSEMEDDPYEYVWTLEWVADDTMLMITGDLVDGRRGSRTVDDPRGSYEMLLHILIYNLRIDARERNSDVLFTIGNHDLYRIFDIPDLL